MKRGHFEAPFIDKNKRGLFSLFPGLNNLCFTKIGCTSEEKIDAFILFFSRFALSLFHEDWLHLGRKNKYFYFVLLSVCVIFAALIKKE